MPNHGRATPRHRRSHAGGFALLFGVLLLACGDGLYPADSLPVTPSITPTPSPTPLPHRADCGAIRESGRYLNVSERDWFLDTCASRPRAYIGYSLLPLQGARLMEVYDVPTGVCPSGIAHTTVDEDLNGEIFSYLFRTFCSPSSAAVFSQLPPPLRCDADEVLTTEEAVLLYYTDFRRTVTEVFCTPPDATPIPRPTAGTIPTQGPLETATPDPGAGLTAVPGG